MNSITQISVFDYREIENLGDLERKKYFLKILMIKNYVKALKMKEKMEEMIIQ